MTTWFWHDSREQIGKFAAYGLCSAPSTELFAMLEVGRGGRVYLLLWRLGGLRISFAQALFQMNDSPAPLLSPTQRKLAGFAIGLVALLSTIVLFIGIIWGLGWLIGHFSSMLWPLAVAGILALILRPLVNFLESKMRGHRIAAVLTIYGAGILLLCGALVVLLPPVVRQIIDLIDYMPTFWTNATAYSQKHFPDWVAAIQGYLQHPAVKDAINKIGGELSSLLTQVIPSLKAAGAGIAGVFSFITHFAIIPIYLFFFMLSRSEPTEKLPEQLTFLSPKVRENIVFLVNEFVGIVVAFFRGQLLIGLLMGVLYAIGFSIIGLKFGLFIGLMLGILNIVPYLGTILGLSIALPLAFFQTEGGLPLLGFVMLVFVLVQNIEGWFLTPRIMGRQTGLHPVAIIVAIFFWGTALGGILGMILAIPLTAFIVTAWRLAKKEYLHS